MKIDTMIKWVIVTNKANHDNKDTFKITTSYYYDGMGNKVMTISEADPAQIAAINIRCNNDTEMYSLYASCTECVDALGLEANYYGREAGGKTLALYNTDPSKGNVADIYQVGYPTIWLDDWYIYGSEADGRIATVDPKEEIISGSRIFGSEFPTALNQMGGSPPADTNLPNAMKEYDLLNSIEGKYQTQQRTPDFRRYEIKDHLGNVRTVISDVKNPENTTGAINFWKYKADVKNISNMYPYGKSYGTNAIYNAIEDYRYGFNGMEKERNIGQGFSDFGARMYDSEFPSFGSPDPIEKKLPANSTYSFAAANPINYIDYFGLQPGKVNNTTDFLIVGIQGYVSASPHNNKTQTKNDNRFVTDYDGVASFMALNESDINALNKVQTFVYATSSIMGENGMSNTQNDIITTIRDFKLKNPEGKIVLVGHSEGAQQLVNLAYKVPEIRIDLTILIDIQAHPDISGTTAHHTAPNMVDTKNFFVDGGTKYGGFLNTIFGYDDIIGGKTLIPLFKGTKIDNIPVKGYDHTGIDQGISVKVLKLIEDFIEINSSANSSSTGKGGDK